MDKVKLYKDVLHDGCSIEIGKLSLCCIDHYINRRDREVRFQVHSEHHKFKFSELYEDCEVAVDKFLLLKKELYGDRG